VSQRTVSAIRQKFALLISKVNFDDPRFARFQRLSASIGRFIEISLQSNVIRLAQKKTVSYGEARSTHLNIGPRRHDHSGRRGEG